MDYDIPAEDTGEILPDKHEAHLTDEVDMFTFESKFEKGTIGHVVARIRQRNS